MLILERRIGETTFVGPKLSVLVDGFAGSGVRLVIHEQGKSERPVNVTLGGVLQLAPDIKLHITSLAGSKVWIGFEAPRSIRIHRPEAKKKTPKGGNP